MNENKTEKLATWQWTLIAAILLSALTGLGVGILRYRGLDSSALLYIGMPTIIALGFAFAPAAKSVMGSTMKGITFVILISGPLLQEGYMCMLMAAPILYIVGGLVAWPFDYYRRKREKENTSKLNIMIVPALLLLMSMEGTIEELTFERENIITRTQIVDKSIADVRSTLASDRRLKTPDSWFARLFPAPEAVSANGLSVGDTQSASLSYFKWIFWNEKKGAIRFEVAESKPRYIRFKLVGDDSYISSYLSWGDSEIFLTPLSDNRTQVSWRISFTRKLDPAWYVQPLQRYTVGVVADTYIASLR